jgi:hypothetical protein
MIITHYCLMRLHLKQESVKPLIGQEIQYFHDVIGNVRVSLA